MGDMEDDLQVDLTPLIDVIFMLVIFFIMTTSFTLPVIDFNLPQATTAQALKRDNTLRISVDKDGIMRFEREEITKEQLPELIASRVDSDRKNSIDTVIELVIDSEAASEHLITVADMARLYTNGRLLIVTDKGEGLADESQAAAGATATTTTATHDRVGSVSAASTSAANTSAEGQ